jgi:endoglucanase
MAKRLTSLLAACALAVLPTAPALATQPAGQNQFVPQDYVVGAWWLYKSEFLDNGRIVDRANGNISHSEGQGYGMLLAVAADDRDTFETIWNWTHKELHVRGDNLAAWKWDPNANPHVSDQNNATDGDLLIAWALMRAGKRWKAPNYTDAARAIAGAIGRKAVIDAGATGKVLLPAASGFSAGEQPDGPVVNLSYWIFPAIRDLGAINPDFPSEALIASGTTLIKTARFGSSQLPSDWISLKGEQPEPAQKFAKNFGYEAVRIPLYAAWYSPEQARLLDKVYDRWKIGGVNAVQVVELATAAPLVAMPDPGYQAVSDLLSCSLGKTTGLNAIGDFQPTDYYPSTLHLISLVAVSERYPQCLPKQN